MGTNYGHMINILPLPPAFTHSLGFKLYRDRVPFIYASFFGESRGFSPRRSRLIEIPLLMAAAPLK